MGLVHQFVCQQSRSSDPHCLQRDWRGGGRWTWWCPDL